MRVVSALQILYTLVDDSDDEDDIGPRLPQVPCRGPKPQSSGTEVCAQFMHTCCVLLFSWNKVIG